MSPDRSFKVFIATSLDGFISSPDGDISWLTNPPEDNSHIPPSGSLTARDAISANLMSVKHIIMGRATFEKVVEMGDWPYSGHQVLVLSTTLPEDFGARVQVVRSIDEALSIIQSREPGDTYVDGGKVIRRFLERGLINEIAITIAPVILGQGLPLFTELSKEVRLTLIEHRVFEGGMSFGRYKVNSEN